ncbi:DUF2909 domain-containing protein [Roseateles toxinivorans]|uniref:DUF2909 family protein n=1 Tax=Roseateles toxinivorans TaxID=270368 RepID=A0A4V3CTC4_9BURK|nr:DUF2909 domain-containing protein [Roseateles toxinivorans]TDP71367.1 DUF2909 family protein [Roseateles toxinivorans]
MKIIIVLILVGILVALAAAGLFMLKRSGKNKPGGMARALALRVGLSVALFLFILLSYKLGWIQPTGIPAGR